MPRLMAKVGELERTEDARLPSVAEHDEPMSQYDPRASDQNPPVPCHYFDYVVGTNTGGFIAIMLGRLRMNIDACKEEYNRLGETIIAKKRHFKHNQYSHRKLKKFVVGLVRDRVSTDESAQDQPDALLHTTGEESRCRTTILTILKAKRATETPHLLRSYPRTPIGASPHPREQARNRNPDVNINCYVWEAAMATFATPRYFRKVEINGSHFRDGGTWENNPSVEGFNEACSMYRQETGASAAQYCPVGVLVSIGNGIGAPLSTFSRVRALRKSLGLVGNSDRSLMDPERVHRHMTETARHWGIPYYRFNVDTGLGDVEMDEWKGVVGNHSITFSAIESATRRYLDQIDVRNELNDCAQQLVNYRRRRCPTIAAMRYVNLSTPGARTPHHIPRWQRTPAHGYHSGGDHAYRHSNPGRQYDPQLQQPHRMGHPSHPPQYPVELPYELDPHELAN
ncbi:hypothetical protein FGG08_003867 [Glutinoglossum americanum]|uniref:PNPLA domain-containing protein n=1 Tax=Glutinoglossum americanum TaxID=1670608 RepID=A0A9P8KXP3_9PEZI|nr:hypothetical protein FGG08_003867 [Glutinoglossum americanum]